MRNATRATMSLFAAAALLGAVGCNGTPPTLSITDAFVAERTDAGTVVHVIVKAENPTKDALPMWAIAYSGGGDGRKSGSIDRWVQATAPAGGSVAFELPVVVTGQAAGTSLVEISAKIEYVPGGKLRELLSELDYPLPTTTFSGTTNVDWSAAPRPPAVLRIGTVQTAQIIDRGPAGAIDTLPPLKKPQ